jgi:peptidoglycan/LPS O-acetylase OafA/YrhL
VDRLANVEESLRTRSSVTRLVELDSARGVAAAVVVLCHLRAPFFSGTQEVWYLRPIFDGFPPVALFFVLSGFVLALPFWKAKQPTYGTYIVRRFFRIYVPYAAAVCFSLFVGMHFSNAQLPLSPWFYKQWHTPFSAAVIARQFLLIDTSGKINVAFWSLRYELEMSLIFPAICFVLRKLSAGMGLTLGLGMYLAGNLAIHMARSSTGWRLESAETLTYASCFVLGALLAREREAIARIYASLTLWQRALFVVATFAIFYCGHIALGIPGACGIVILALNSSASKWLRHAVLEYLGRISYSLYLVHVPIVLMFFILLYGRVPLWVLVGLCLPVILGVSHLFCILVEEPSMRLGKYLAGQMQPAKSPAGPISA